MKDGERKGENIRKHFFQELLVSSNSGVVVSEFLENLDEIFTNYIW